MSNIGAFEAKTHLSALLDQVAKGEEITITRHGHPVARLVPVGRNQPERARAAAIRLKRLAQGQTLDGLPVRELIEAGRR